MNLYWIWLLLIKFLSYKNLNVKLLKLFAKIPLKIVKKLGHLRKMLNVLTYFIYNLPLRNIGSQLLCLFAKCLEY